MKKRNKIIYTTFVLIAAILIGVGYWYEVVHKQEDSLLQTAPVERGDLVQTVTATGKVKSSSEIDLSFKINGRLDDIYVDKGQHVDKDEILAKLDTHELELAVEEKRSAYNLAVANLNLKLAGSSQESIDLVESEVEQAKSSLEKAKDDFKAAEEDLENTKKTNAESIKEAELAVEAANDAVSTAQKDLDNILATNENNIDNAYESAIIEIEGNLVVINSVLSDMDSILGVDDEDINDSFESLLGAINKQKKTDAEDQYRLARDSYNKSKDLVDGITSQTSQDEKDSIIDEVKQTLNMTSSALIAVRTLLDNTITGASLSQTDLDSYRSTIDTDRTSINTELSALESSKQSIESAKLAAQTNEDSYKGALETAKNNLSTAEQNLEQVKATAKTNLSKAEAAVVSAKNQVDIATKAVATAEAKLSLEVASPRDVDVASLRAQVSQAQVALDLALSNLEDATLKAPIAGVITRVAFDVGEQITANQAVISLLGDEEYSIEADISESDIAKVEIGQEVEITLDAFGDDFVFPGKIIRIDPAATVIQDVIYYKVETSFDSLGRSIKPDMTANITIFTGSKDGVLYIPQRAITQRDGEKFVKILQVDGTIIEKNVTTGLRGDGGLIEVTSGLSEGEQVVTFDKSQKKVRF